MYLSPVLKDEIEAAKRARKASLVRALQEQRPRGQKGFVFKKKKGGQHGCSEVTKNDGGTRQAAKRDRSQTVQDVYALVRNLGFILSMMARP